MSAKGAAKPVRQRLLNGRIQIISRSGLNHCEVALIETLGRITAGEEKSDRSPVVLTMGNRTGVLGQVACDLVDGTAILHTFDIHHHRSMPDNVEAGFRNRVTAVCTPDIPEPESEDQKYDWVLFQLNRNNFSTELVYDLIQQSATHLAQGGRLLFAIEGTPTWLVKRLKQYFKNVQIEAPNRNVSVVLATNLKEIPKQKNFQSVVDVTLPDGVEFPMVTYPEVFAHRRSDEGGLSLAETTDVTDGDRVFDMGCGAGLIGLALAKIAKLEKLTLVDSHARAIKAATENVQRNQLEDIATVLQSDGSAEDFVDHLGQYSLFVGNPPYYSQNQVTQRFVELASEILAVGGRATFVTKNPEWLGQEIGRYFGEVQFFSRRHYTILRAVKN